jgi:hypothetical protein
MTETTLKRFLRCRFRRTGKEMGQVNHCWWRICREINAFFFQFRISHVLRVRSICDLFTDPPPRIPTVSTRKNLAGKCIIKE